MANPVQPQTPSAFFLSPGIQNPYSTSASSSVTQAPPTQIESPLVDDLVSQWRHTKCLTCGHIHEGTGVLTTCPQCGNTDPDKFQEAE